MYRNVNVLTFGKPKLSIRKDEEHGNQRQILGWKILLETEYT